MPSASYSRRSFSVLPSSGRAAGFSSNEHSSSAGAVDGKSEEAAAAAAASADDGASRDDDDPAVARGGRCVILLADEAEKPFVGSGRAAEDIAARRVAAEARDTISYYFLGWGR